MFQLIPSVIRLDSGLTVVSDADQHSHRTTELLYALNNSLPRNKRVRVDLFTDYSTYWGNRLDQLTDLYRSLDIRVKSLDGLRSLMTEENNLVIIETKFSSPEKLEEEFFGPLLELRQKAITHDQCIVLSVPRPYWRCLIERADKAFTVNQHNHWTVVKSREVQT